MRILQMFVGALLSLAACAFADPVKPLRALMITGGCCHDYASQKKILVEGLSARLPVEWTVVHDVEMVDGKDVAAAREHRSSAYASDSWAAGYDVVVHNECYGAMKDAAVLARIAKGHEAGGVPAVFLHCSMHSYRMAAAPDADQWRRLVGAKSMYHEPGTVLTVKAASTGHPVMKGFPAVFTTPDKDELYIIEKQADTALALAHSYSEKLRVENPVIWVNEVGKLRTFATSLGHNNAVVAAPEYLDLVGRGLLWVCGKLDGAGNPAAGYEAPKR